MIHERDERAVGAGNHKIDGVAVEQADHALQPKRQVMLRGWQNYDP
jgi:hypothetical protein